MTDLLEKEDSKSAEVLIRDFARCKNIGVPVLPSHPTNPTKFGQFASGCGIEPGYDLRI